MIKQRRMDTDGKEYVQGKVGVTHVNNTASLCLCGTFGNNFNSSDFLVSNDRMIVNNG
jgi:hypothetical protein